MAEHGAESTHPPGSEVTSMLDIGGAPVATEIARDDEMFQGSPEHYFSVGRSALETIRLALAAAGKQDVARILDFPCGHGRVLRFLRAAYPDATLTACDLSRAAVDFCARTFGATPVYSSKRAEDVRLDGRFDLIWCGSLLTHLDAGRFESFVRLFVSVLETDGVLVLTTHGRRSLARIEHEGDTYGLDARGLRRLLRHYRRHRFGYADYPGGSDYGVSLAAPSWVCGLVERILELRIVHLVEQGWDDHHDVIACTRLGAVVGPAAD